MRGLLLSVIGLCLVLPVCAQEAAPTQDVPLISAGVMSARLTKRVQPEFPKDAVEQGVSGVVTLRALVSKSGKVDELTFVEGPEVFREAAIKAVRKWRYKPFEKDGEPVAVQTLVRVRFGMANPYEGRAHLAGAQAGDGKMPDGPVRLSSGVMARHIIQKVQPKYPQEARRSGVTGSVVLHAIIGKDGTIKELKVVSGPYMLQTAAMEAVRQWRYHPYVLNGEPVEVDTTITVNFNIGQPRE